MPNDSLERSTRRFEAVCLAIAGHTYAEISRKMRLSSMRVQGMIEEQAGHDFYPQLVLERRKKQAKVLGFMKVNERIRKEVRT
jgi:hypothetical protein